MKAKKVFTLTKLRPFSLLPKARILQNKKKTPGMLTFYAQKYVFKKKDKISCLNCLKPLFIILSTKASLLFARVR